MHELLLSIFGDVPAQALPILHALGVTDAVDGTESERARRVDTSIQPQLRTARTSDLVVEVPLHDGRLRSVIVEVQLEVRSSKRGSWALYWAAEFDRTDGDVWIVVLTSEPEVTRWALSTLPRVIPSAGHYAVLGPGTIPRIEDVDAARRAPDAAVLSALVYAGKDGDDRLIPALVETYSTISAERAKIIDDIIRSRLTPAGLLLLEKLMQTTGYVWQSEFAKAHREEGREEGRVEGQQGMLLSFLEHRGFAVDEAARARIAACTDSARLEVWLLRAAHVLSLAEVFE